MSKYSQLWEYVKTNAPEILTFDQIEEICGFPVDHSLLKYKKELPEYGFEVGKISIKEKTVRFNKVQ